MVLEIYCTCQYKGVIQKVGIKNSLFMRSREEIVKILKNKEATVFTYANGKIGAKVVLTDDGKFITTEGNQATRDNLDSLPECQGC